LVNVYDVRNDDSLYCICKDVEHGKNDLLWQWELQYYIRWFHYNCVGIKRKPKGLWYCLDCCFLPQFQNKKANPKRSSSFESETFVLPM
jgi:hypothetical protein